MTQSKKTKNNKSKVKMAFEWMFNIFCFVLVILALLMAIASISRTVDQETKGIGIASLGNITYAPVVTDSMEPVINVGDLAIGRKYKGQELVVGDIITFRTVVDGKAILNTHEIIEVVSNPNGTIAYLRTKGVNASSADENPVDISDVLSIYKSSAKGLGKPIIWLQSDPQHFFLGVVLPIILLFIIYAAIFIRALVNAALGKKRLAAATVDGLSEEDKKKLAEEYLAKLEAEKKQQSLTNVVSSSNDDVKQDDTQVVDTNKDDTADNVIQDDNQVIADNNKDSVADDTVQDGSQQQDNTNTQDSVVDNKEDSKTAEDSSSDK